MATPTLTGMPLELLVHLIATYLPTQDLGSLRLTNKFLEKALFDTFAKEYFTKRQFMLTTPSLQTLIAISRHGALNKYLRHVIIGLESYQATLCHRIPSYRPDGAEVNIFRKGYADQFALMSSGRDRQMLAEAFRNLPNMETLGIRDYEAYGRVRDTSNLWRSYGAPTVYLETGHVLKTGPSKFASQVFLLLIQALADAARCIPSIETILRQPDTGLTDFAFFLPPEDRPLDTVLDGLQRLLLTLNLSEPDALVDISGLAGLLKSFLLRTPSLRHLRLNFKRHEYTGPAVVLSQLSIADNLLPSLQRLDFGMMKTRPEFLVHIVSKFSRTLRHVSLWKVMLDYSTGPRWKDSQDRYHPWPRVLQDLLTTTQLAGMTIGCISHDFQGVPLNVNFKSGKDSQEYSGDIKIWIPRLIDDLTVTWPQLYSSSEIDDEDDDDEGEGLSEEDSDMDV